MDVAVNIEQLLHRAPGGTGRYSARLVTQLTSLFPADTVLPFTALHRREDVVSACRAFGLDAAGVAPPAVLGLPRPLLYEAWHLVGQPRLEWMAPSLRRADLVHAPSPAVPPRGPRPLVVTVHDVAFELYPEAYPPRGRRFHRRGVEAAARRADLVITATEASVREIADHTPIDPRRLRIVPNGVDDAVPTPVETAEVLARYHLEDAPYVLWVGSLEPRKNVGTLVRAFARVVAGDAFPHRLVLAGPVGWLEDGLIPERERAVLGERLRSVGQVSDADLRALYAGAEAFCFPSLSEGFGLPVLEAMVQGTPVVCADVPALREVAGGAAVLVPPLDVPAWTDALGDLLGRPGAREPLRTAGRARAAEFSWGRTAAATRDVYLEALGGPTGPPSTRARNR